MKNIQLSIPQPCHEQWNEMTPTEQGRYCNACSKVVIDFSKMSDGEVLNYFTNAKTEMLCGRLYNDQLNRNITSPPKRKWYYSWNLALSFLLFFTKCSNVKGEVVVKKEEIEQAFRSNAKSQEDLLFQSKRIVTGIVVDEKGNSVPFASVTIVGSKRGVAANELGKFSITIGKNDTIIIVSAVTYVSQQININSNETLKVVLKSSSNLTNITLGAIVVRGCTVKGKISCGTKSTSIKKITDNFKSIFSTKKPELKIYPNPVYRGSTCNVEINSKATGVGQLQVIDINGRLLQEKEINITSSTQIEKIQIPDNFTAGTYVVQLVINKQKITNRTFIIQ